MFEKRPILELKPLKVEVETACPLDLAIIPLRSLS